MPKRKKSDDEGSEKIRKKIKRMEKKLKKHRRRLQREESYSSDFSIPCNTPVPSVNEDVEDSLPVYEVCDEFEVFETAATADGASAPLLSTKDDGSRALAPFSNPTPPTPPTQAAAVAAVSEPEQGTSSSGDKSTNDDMILDEEILSFLVEAPNEKKKYGPKIQNDIASRWEHVATSGVTKEVRKDFIEKYLTPENCSLTDPPALNLEVKAAMTDALQKKDMAIQNKQKQISAAISCIGQALKRALTQDQKDVEAIKLLIEVGRIISDVQHTESLMRRGFIGSCIKKDVKDHLNGTRIDKYLFGEKLADTLKTAKSFHKSGSEIKATASAPGPSMKNKAIFRPLNSKRPAATNRPAPAGRRLDEATPAAPPPQPPLPRSQQQRPRTFRR